ncbi:MAG TPA: DUF4158 domain-containing protein, partial [Acinetobacter sp.]|nr:DUF4158 domain-containing protein [Acinetobacter sp.]
MKIFNTLEQATFDTPPVFNSTERKQFFALPLMLQDAMAGLRTPTNKVCFLAAVGYFKARRKFFARNVNSADIDYIARQLNLSIADVDITSYTKFACIHHQRIILDYFGCRPFDATTMAFAKSEIAMLAPVQYQPKQILIEIIQILSREKIEVPSYNVLADLIIT